jgi:hypothetical protein
MVWQYSSELIPDALQALLWFVAGSHGGRRYA